MSEETSNGSAVRTALVADDEETLRELLGTKLRRDGYRVLTAATGEECIEIFRRERPQVVITDIMMPGMSGEEVVQTVKAESPATITIIVTAYATMDSVLRMLDTGCDGYLTKPIVNLDTLGVAIRQAASRRRALTRSAVLERMSRRQSEILLALLEGFVPSVERLQDNLGALGSACEARDVEETHALLDAAQEEIAALGELLDRTHDMQDVLRGRLLSASMAEHETGPGEARHDN